jgi:hypothetical protein
MKSVLDVHYDPEEQRKFLYAGNKSYASVELTSDETKRDLIGRMRWQII